MVRRPRKDDAPTCEDERCHGAKMDIIEKHGKNWHFRCPKCGYICTASSCKKVPQALKDYMKEGRVKKEEKKVEAPK